MFEKSSMTFINNIARDVGGALAVNSASVGIDTDIIRLFNTRCFVLYDVRKFPPSLPAEEWRVRTCKHDSWKMTIKSTVWLYLGFSGIHKQHCWQRWSCHLLHWHPIVPLYSFPQAILNNLRIFYFQTASFLFQPEYCHKSTDHQKCFWCCYFPVTICNWTTSERWQRSAKVIIIIFIHN